MPKLLFLCIVVSSLPLAIAAAPSAAIAQPDTPLLSGKALSELLDWISRYDARVVKEEPEKIQLALRSLEAALQSDYDEAFSSAAWDVVNGRTRNLPEDELLRILLPAVRTPAPGVSKRSGAQIRLLERVSVLFGPRAKALLPDLLTVVRDDTIDTWHRGYAIDAAARIGPKDAEVVRAFIGVLNSPNPKDDSRFRGNGIHDRIVKNLGDMGPAAWPAKKAIEVVLRRGEVYHDGVFQTLGKLALDETPGPLADYLDRLKQIDKLPMEQVAAAFLHVQAMCAMDPTPPDSPRVRQEKYTLAERARPVLYGLVEHRRADDVYGRAALDTLFIIGPGASPEGAKVLVRVITSVPYHDDHRFDLAGKALTRFEAKDTKAVLPLADGLAKLVGDRGRVNNQRIIVETLERFGKDARPALPVLLKTLEHLQVDSHGTDVLACAFAISGLERDAPEGRALLVRLLDARGPFMKRRSRTASPEEVRDNLMVALSPMGIAQEGEERARLLEIVLAGLKSEDQSYHTAAALIVQRNAADLTQREADELVPQLARVVAEKYCLWFSPPRNGSCGGRLPSDVRHLYGQGMSVQALGSLGKKASKALPELEAFAARDLSKTPTLSYSSRVKEGPIHHAIREARKAVVLVR